MFLKNKFSSVRYQGQAEKDFSSALSSANGITVYPITMLCISIERKKLPSGFDSCLAARKVLGKTTNSRESMTKSN